MKISIITPDVSHNCLGRAYLLAKLLQKEYEVEIIGAEFGQGIWKPVRFDKSIKYKTVKLKGLIAPYFKMIKLVRLISGDIIYVHKPLMTSYGVGFLKRMITNKPLILDIDDWQRGFAMNEIRTFKGIVKFRYVIKSVLFPYRIDSYFNHTFWEKHTSRADATTVSNPVLQKKFGGSIIWHARDMSRYDPDKYSKEGIRKKYNLPLDKKLIIFFGTLRPHKGVKKLIKAIEIIKNKDIGLIIAGLNLNIKYEREIHDLAKRKLKDKFYPIGYVQFNKIPDMLVAADIVVIPQVINPASEAQIPAKLFDAMAMAKPIITSNISPIKDVIKNNGWLLSSNDPKSIKNSINDILNNNELSIKRGEQARLDCLKNYSYRSARTTLIPLIRHLHK